METLKEGLENGQNTARVYAKKGFFEEDVALIAQRVSKGAFDPVPRGMIDNLPRQTSSTPKKKVMLVLPNHRWALDQEEHYTMGILFQTQICLLAAQIEDKYDVVIVDCIIDDLSEKDFEEIVRREKPDVVGLSNFTHEFSKAGHKAVDIVKSINPSTTTIMGGVYVITSPNLAIVNKNLDFAIIGEGELLIKQILAHIHEGSERPSKGLAFRYEQGRVIIQERAAFNQNLDQLKYPAYHLIDYFKYSTRYQREAVSRPRALPFARVCMTRGCPIGCTFCTVESISGGPTRYRSAEHMYGEMEMLVKKYGVKCFLFDDDNLFMNKNKANELLQLIIDRQLNILWMLEATALFCMDEHTIDLCAQSRCQYLNIAIESGSERVIKEVIKKPIHFPRVKELIAKLKSVGIEINSNFVIGNPGETWDEILETIRYAEEIDIDYVKFFICTPFPKTKMFEMAKKMGYLDDSLKFDEHHWTGGTFNTPHWRAKDLAVVRAYEWDRINFSNPKKREKIRQMLDVSMERLEQIRRATRELANPEVAQTKKEGTELKANKYVTTKEKSAEQAKEEVIKISVEAADHS